MANGQTGTVGLAATRHVVRKQLLEPERARILCLNMVVLIVAEVLWIQSLVTMCPVQVG